MLQVGPLRCVSMNLQGTEMLLEMPPEALARLPLDPRPAPGDELPARLLLPGGLSLDVTLRLYNSRGAGAVC